MSLTMHPIKYTKINICKISSYQESTDTFLLQERKGTDWQGSFFLFSFWNTTTLVTTIALTHIDAYLVGNLLGNHHVHRKTAEKQNQFSERENNTNISKWSELHRSGKNYYGIHSKTNKHLLLYGFKMEKHVSWYVKFKWNSQWRIRWDPDLRTHVAG